MADPKFSFSTIAPTIEEEAPIVNTNGEDKPVVVDDENKPAEENKEVKLNADGTEIKEPDAPKPPIKEDKKKGVERFQKKAAAASGEPDYKSLYESEKSEKAKLKEYFEKPVLNSLIKAIEEGKDPKSVLKPFYDEDPERFSHEDLIRRDLKRQGVSSEKIEEEIENFNTITSEYQKRAITNPLLETEKRLYTEASKLIGWDELNKSKQPSQEEVDFNSRFVQEVEQNSDKEVLGLIQDSKITRQMLELAKSGKMAKLYDENGKLDVDASYIATLAGKNWEKLSKSIYTQAYEEGKAEAEAEKKANRPLVTGTGGGSSASELNDIQKLNSGKAKVSFGTAPQN